MNIKDLDIEQQVEYINQELLKGRSMKQIEQQDFGVNERVISKRLSRKGYKRVNNQFVKSITEVIQEDKCIEITTPKDNILKYNKDINDDKLIELIDMVDTLKEIIEHYNKNKNVIDIEINELKPKAVTEVKQKLFKVDAEVLKKWEKFVSEHKEFKVQQLISLALEEFIQKYN